MSDKKGLLPIVTREVGAAISAERSTKEDDKKFLERLVEDNPAILEFIERDTGVMKGIEAKQASIYTAISVYRLLESQAEANRMNQEYLMM